MCKRVEHHELRQPFLLQEPAPLSCERLAARSLPRPWLSLLNRSTYDMYGQQCVWVVKELNIMSYDNHSFSKSPPP